jgi:hypothetical protein
MRFHESTLNSNRNSPPGTESVLKVASWRVSMRLQNDRCLFVLDHGTTVVSNHSTNSCSGFPSRTVLTSGQHIELVVYIYIEKEVLFKNRKQPVPAFLHLESFAPCFRDLPSGAVSVGTLRELRLAASRGNRVQTNAQGTGFRAVHRGPGPAWVLTFDYQGLTVPSTSEECSVVLTRSRHYVSAHSRQHHTPAQVCPDPGNAVANI